MIGLQHYKELSLKVFLGTEVMFRPGISLKAPTVKTIALFSEKHYLELCSYLPKLRELALNEPDQAYGIIQQVFAQHPELNVYDFYNFLALFFVDTLDINYKNGVKLIKGNQYLIIRPTDLAWLFNLIFLISGTFNKAINPDNPASEGAARILEKIRRAKEKKAKEAAEEENRNSFEIIRAMGELLCIKAGYKIKDINECNLFQLMSLGARAQGKEEYDTHLAYSMIPMVDHSKDKPFDHWMKSFRYNIGMDDESEQEPLTPEQEETIQTTKTVDSIDFSKAMTVTADMADEFE